LTITRGSAHPLLHRIASGRARSGYRGSMKTKNRDYWRYEMEREAAFKVKRTRQFV
jgi:hypothetical protein